MTFPTTPARRVRRWTGAGALALAATLVLTGCTGGSDDSSDETASSAGGDSAAVAPDAAPGVAAPDAAESAGDRDTGPSTTADRTDVPTAPTTLPAPEARS